jgi:hypothetical protein
MLDTIRGYKTTTIVILFHEFFLKNGRPLKLDGTDLPLFHKNRS